MWTYSPFGNGNYTSYNHGLINNGASGYTDPLGNLIASGQAFYVQATTAGSVTFLESHKSDSTTPNTQYFGTANKKVLRIKLKDAGNANSVLDEATVRFCAMGTSVYDRNWDALSLSSGAQTLATLKGTSKLAIASRPENLLIDTVKLFMESNTAGSYQLCFAGIDALGTMVTLRDKFLQQDLDLTSVPDYSFNVTSDSSSKGGNRFEVVFKNTAPLSVSFINVAASKVENGVAVEWKVGKETNLAAYQVERSTDVKEFATIANIMATGAADYRSIDVTLPKTANVVYYRVRATEQGGATTLSKTVKIVLATQEVQDELFSIYPNPVQDKLNVTLGTAGGNAQLKLVDMKGKTVLNNLTVLAGNENSFDVKELPAGIYIAEMTDRNGTKTIKRIVKN